MYRYIPDKPGKKVHEVSPKGRTYCQAENSAKRLVDSQTFPLGRKACFMCKKIKRQIEDRKFREPRLAVLMGEAIE